MVSEAAWGGCVRGAGLAVIEEAGGGGGRRRLDGRLWRRSAGARGGHGSSRGGAATGLGGVDTRVGCATDGSRLWRRLVCRWSRHVGRKYQVNLCWWRHVRP